MKTKAIYLFLVLALQVGWIAGTVAWQESLLRHGTVILVETAPVDPRDLLRGDYVILNYPFSNLPAHWFSGAETNALAPGDTVYLRMVKRGEYHVAESGSRQPLPPDPEKPVLRGEITHTPRWFGEPGAATTHETVQLKFGLERYYVREGTGTPQGKLTVAAVVGRRGNALIQQVFLDGKPYAEAMRTVSP